MTNKEAKKLVSFEIKKTKKGRRSFFKELLYFEALLNSFVLPLDAIAYYGTSQKGRNALAPLMIIFHSLALAIGAIISIENYRDVNHDELSALDDRIYLLKNLRHELKHNINRFESVDVSDFDIRLKEIENANYFIKSLNLYNQKN